MAFDKGKMVGRNLLSFCYLSVAGQLQECVVSQNLYVKPEYRKLGVGVYIKMHVLKLGFPQISSGVSKEMRKVYDSWSNYVLVDNSPIYSIPASLRSLIRYSRLVYYTELQPAPSSSRGKLVQIMMRIATSTGRLFFLRSPDVHKLDPRQAMESLTTVLSLDTHVIQVPWDKQKVKRALKGQETNMLARIFEIKTGNKGTKHLLTAYLRPQKARVIGNRNRILIEAHVNEIFPAIQDESMLPYVLGEVLREIRKQRIDTLKLYANTGLLRDAVDRHGFPQLETKSVYVAPKGVDADQAAILTNPSNWWCRAINETQFEEATVP